MDQNKKEKHYVARVIFEFAKDPTCLPYGEDPEHIAKSVALAHIKELILDRLKDFDPPPDFEETKTIKHIQQILSDLNLEI